MEKKTKMGKKLAIKGHPTRGKEVIELLEMLGGKNKYNLTGTKEIWYILSNNKIKHSAYLFDEKGFTLEEFLEKYPFKVGDVIRFPNDMVEEIAEMKWDEELEDIIYTSVSGWTRPCQVPKNTNNETNMNTDCEKCCLHYGSASNPVKTKSYAVSLKDGEVVDNSIDASQFMQIGKIAAVCFNTENYEDEVELQLGDYEIEVRGSKTYAIRKKPKYPKTYKECFNVCFGNKHHIIQVVGLDGDNKELFESFIKLKICRDAYWKIYGEEIGLGKPWEPNWTTFEGMPAIFRFRYNIVCDFVCDSIKSQHCLLVFPTAEMRNSFYENFKDLIEQCKELL